MLEEILRKNGLKITESRKLVLNALSQEHGPMTVDEIYRRIISQNSLDYSTVYRILSVFTRKNIVLKCIGGDSIAYYQLYEHNHNHYLVCSKCHKRVMIEDCPLEEISKKLVENTGFHITGHNLEFTGECPDCIHKKL
jgi:Fur family transcriptional regulator, ferric uptake regulator